MDWEWISNKKVFLFCFTLFISTDIDLELRKKDNPDLEAVNKVLVRLAIAPRSLELIPSCDAR